MVKLTPPVTPLWVNQYFGGNASTYKRFGLAGHNGLDLALSHGQPVYASHDGIATYSIDKSEGHGVDVVSETKLDLGPHGKAYLRTKYWHLCDPKKEPQFASPIFGKKSVRVKAGDLIGYGDSTGFSTGDHLHFGLKPVDKLGRNLFQQNGYLGAVDPAPFLNVERTLKLGSKGMHVMTFQSVLKRLGYFPAKQDLTTYYGPITQKAYAQFRKETGLILDVDSQATGNEDVVGYGGMDNLSRAGVGLYVLLLEALFRAFGVEVPDGTALHVINSLVTLGAVGLLIWGQIARKDLKFGLFRR